MIKVSIHKGGRRDLKRKQTHPSGERKKEVGIKTTFTAELQWLTPVILANQKAEIRRIKV
jgi:hypothetical protein